MSNNVISYILTHIKANIPPEILDVAFGATYFNTSIDGRLLAEVIYARILPSMDVTATGLEKQIFLETEWLEDVDPAQFGAFIGLYQSSDLYRIPAKLRENRRITHANYVGYNMLATSNTPHSLGIIQGELGNTVPALTKNLIESHTMTNISVKPTIRLLSGDLILVTPSVYNYGIFVNCVLGHDQEFTNFPTGAIVHLAELCLNATKTHCYNTLRIKIDKNEQITGAEIGSFKEIIMSYENEVSLFREKLSKVKGHELITGEKHKRLLRFTRL